MRPLFVEYLVILLFLSDLTAVRAWVVSPTTTFSQRSCPATTRNTGPAGIRLPIEFVVPEFHDSHRRHGRLVLFATTAPEQDNEQNESSSEHQKSIGRVGGRNKLKSSSRKNPKEEKRGGIIWWTVPAVLLSLLLFKGILLPENPSFYYYESSLYESRTYDGRVETTSRKESVRSNIPSLLEEPTPGQERNDIILRQRQQQQELLERSIENDIREEFNSAMRLQEAILDDLF